MKWFVLIVLIVSAGILGFLYVNIDKVTPTGTTSAGSQTQEVVVTHSYKDGVHRFSGQVKLPHSCFAVDSIATRDPKDANSIIIQVSTKDRSAEWNSCAFYSTRYQFQVLEDAPQYTPFSLQIDGKQQPIQIVEASWESTDSEFTNPI